MTKCHWCKREIVGYLFRTKRYAGRDQFYCKNLDRDCLSEKIQAVELMRDIMEDMEDLDTGETW